MKSRRRAKRRRKNRKRRRGERKREMKGRKREDTAPQQTTYMYIHVLLHVYV